MGSRDYHLALSASSLKWLKLRGGGEPSGNGVCVVPFSRAGVWFRCSVDLIG